MRVARREPERRLDARPATGVGSAVAAVAIRVCPRGSAELEDAQRTKSLSAVNVAEGIAIPFA